LKTGAYADSIVYENFENVAVQHDVEFEGAVGWQVEDKTILLLWGKGTGFDHQKVVVTRFNLEWLTDGKDSLGTKTDAY